MSASVVDYLTPWPRRDVLGLPVDAVQDIAGWDWSRPSPADQRNAVLGEWARSPIVYGGDLVPPNHPLPTRCPDVADPAAIVQAVPRARWCEELFADAAAGLPVLLKPLFYARAPAAALRWLLVHPGSSVLPTLRGAAAEATRLRPSCSRLRDLLAASAAGRGWARHRATCRCAVLSVRSSPLPRPARALVSRAGPTPASVTSSGPGSPTIGKD